MLIRVGLFLRYASSTHCRHHES